jgi:hypothetical protein
LNNAPDPPISAYFHLNTVCGDLCYLIKKRLAMLYAWFKSYEILKEVMKE